MNLVSRRKHKAQQKGSNSWKIWSTAKDVKSETSVRWRSVNVVVARKIYFCHFLVQPCTQNRERAAWQTEWFVSEFYWTYVLGHWTHSTDTHEGIKSNGLNATERSFKETTLCQANRGTQMFLMPILLTDSNHFRSNCQHTHTLLTLSEKTKAHENHRKYQNTK